jgi:uncharacterized membrane protein
MPKRRIVTMDSSVRRTRLAFVAALALAGSASATPVLQPELDDVSDGRTDNCMLISNPDQQDTDQDGYGNACDPDLNNDGVVNFTDLATLKERFFTNDPDADFNGDGAVNFVDLSLLSQMFFGPPGPNYQGPRDPGGIPVSAPGTAALLLAGALAWRSVRRLRA